MTRKPVAAPAEPPANAEFVGTKDAAQILGVSVSTVQKMVDDGTLKAWRTGGGHRRLSMESVMAAAEHFKNGLLAGAEESRTAPMHHARTRPVRLLIVEDNQISRKVLSRAASGFEGRLEVCYARDAAEALLKCAEWEPDLIITDLLMEPFDGFHLIRVLRNSERLARIHVLVVTGLSEEDRRIKGELPEDVLVYRKPVSMDRISGFLDAYLLKSR